jgi:membrane protease subunit HflC
MELHMSRRFAAILVLTLAVALAVLWRVVVVVDETQFVLVTTLGRPVALYGDEPGESGLHAKWPWQSATAIDRRLQVSDPPSREVITGDKKNLDISCYVVWRVADPLRFIRSAGTLDAASRRLDERIAAALSDAVGSRTLDSLASTDAALWKLDALTAAIVGDVEAPARRELGVDVLDVRLRRFSYPVEVRSAVFDLIRSERRKVADTLRAEGEAAYLTVTSEADRERDVILARAEGEATRIRAQGEAEATRVLNEAHARDPKFYEFLRTLEAYRAILDDKATVVLSASSPLLRLLSHGPGDELLDEGTPERSHEPSRVAGGESDSDR